MTPEQSRAARALLNWTQPQLAEAAHVGLSTIRDFETGKRQPIVNNLAAISSALESAGIQFVDDGVTASGKGVVLVGGTQSGG